MIINANLFPSLDKSKLHPGDIFKGQAVRAATAEAPLDRAVFLGGVAELNTISPQDTKLYGLSKELVFSSPQDLQKYIDDSQMPPDVDYVELNFEMGMTPQTEFTDPAPAVSQFAAIAHSHGKKVTFDPGGSLFRQLESSGKLGSVLKGVDILAYQGQGELLRIGEGPFLTSLTRYRAATRSNAIPFAVQLWVGTDGCQTMVRVFKEAQSSIDIMAIGTHNDGPGANCVLSGLRS